jgi:hypothetical protein
MEIFRVIVGLLISLCVLLQIFGSLAGIVFAIKAATNKDKVERKKDLWIMAGCFLGPAALLFVILSIWGLVAIFTSTFAA